MENFKNFKNFKNYNTNSVAKILSWLSKGLLVVYKTTSILLSYITPSKYL